MIAGIHGEYVMLSLNALTHMSQIDHKQANDEEDLAQMFEDLLDELDQEEVREEAEQEVPMDYRISDFVGAGIEDGDIVVCTDASGGSYTEGNRYEVFQDGLFGLAIKADEGWTAGSSISRFRLEEPEEEPSPLYFESTPGTGPYEAYFFQKSRQCGKSGIVNADFSDIEKRIMADPYYFLPPDQASAPIRETPYGEESISYEEYLDSIAGQEETPLEGTNPITSDGGSTAYYGLPEHAEELRHLISHKAMSKSRGDIFKACYRLGEKSGSDILYDLKKIKFFADDLIEMYERDEHV